MKKLLLTFIAIITMVNLQAAGFYETIDGLYYYINTTEKTATLSKGSISYSGDIVVPENVTLVGIVFPVVAFAEECFMDCDSLKSVTIPSSVRSLGDYCFAGCDGLWSIVIPSSVTTLGDYCFYNSHLIAIDLPSSLRSLGDLCFANTRLMSISLPSSVTSLGESCFSNCESITSIDFSTSSYVKSLSDSCFFGCSSLSSIAIPSSVTSLGAGCFSGCRSLSSIAIPSSVTSLGAGCFSGCRSLLSIAIPSSVTSLGAGCFSGCQFLTSVSIPSSITSLGAECFSGCQSLSSIAIPSSVISLGDGCFSDCSSLSSIAIPSSVTSLGTHCFGDCSSLTYIAIPPYVKSLGEACFSGCSSLSSIAILSPVTNLGDSCFSGCSSLTSFDIPSSVTSLGAYCFSDCNSLLCLNIPSSVTNIGKGCLSKCSRLDTVYCYAEEPPVITGELAQNKIMAYLAVPTPSIDKYKVAEGWKDFAVIVDFYGKYKGVSVVPNISGTTVTLTNASATAGTETASIDFSAQGLCNGAEATKFILSDGTKITFDKGENKNNTPKYYNATKGIRVYLNNIIRFFSVKEIAKVVMTCDSYNGTDYVGNRGASTTFVGNNYVVYTNSDAGVTSGGVQLRVKNITITYAQSEDGSTGITPEKAKRGIVVSTQNGTVTLSGLNDGERVSFYSVSGSNLGAATANNGIATSTFATGQIIIAKVGNTSMKIAL